MKKSLKYKNDSICPICLIHIPGMTTREFSRHVSKSHPACYRIGRKLNGSIPVYMWNFQPIIDEFSKQVEADNYSCLGETAWKDRPRDLYVSPSDPVNRPTHYTSSPSGIECIDAIESALSSEEFRGYLKGNVIKYSWREKLKGGDEDLKKARWYLSRLVDGLDKKKGDAK